MRHARIERWSCADSPVHRRHAAARILATLSFLVSIATFREGPIAVWPLFSALLVVAILAARLPVFALLKTAAAVLPFALCFAIVTAIAGDRRLAAQLVLRSYLSALAALWLVATTPVPELIAGLEWLRAPRFLLQVMQFLYRYLIVLMEEAAVMAQARAARAGTLRALHFRQAAGAAGVLFARSYSRAEAIHRAMLARGFDGRLPVFRRARFTLADAAFVAGCVALAAGVRTLG
ncbi:MAG TPA: energy-coupling factor transporter transmembrane component T [Bryobacteraceae bacterium]|nr:energy-coupling factor transporter transmembrane component T [Bryobacteraceae bacterium]